MGVFKYDFVANFLVSLTVKEFFEYRLIFGEVMGKSLVSCFFDSRCSVIPALRHISVGGVNGITYSKGVQFPKFFIATTAFPFLHKKG